MILIRLLSSLLSLLFVVNIAFAQQAPSCGFDSHHQRLIENSADYRKQHNKYLNEVLPELSTIQSRNAQAPIIRIPVVVHVIHAGEPIGVGQNLSVARIEEQIEILNRDFNGETPGFDTPPAQWANAIGNPEIQFCLATTDPSGNPTNGITRDQIVITGTNSDNHNIEDDVKPATNWNPNLYYNIYTLPIPGTTAGGGVTGYAYLPFNGTVGNGSTDGSVVDYRWFGGPNTGGSGASTLIHETGHYLGLYHPFNGESCSADDGIADTPNISSSTGFVGNCSNGWPTGPMSCGNEAMYINFMDYTSPDACVTSFSNGQINVMRGVLNGTASGWGSRQQLANNATSVCSFLSFDIEASEIITPMIVNCDNDPITPQVAIKNVGIEAITTLEINYQVDANPIVTFNWADNLISGETRIIDLPGLTPPASNYQFRVWTNNPNGVADQNLLNDEVIILTEFYSSPPFLEDFQSATFDPTPNGVFAINVEDDDWSWEYESSIGAYGLSPGGCAKIDNYNDIGGQSPTGTTDWLVTKSFKVDDLSAMNFNFDYAYNYINNTFSDTLDILASTDCGMTFPHLLFSKGGSDLATVPGPTGGPFVPNGNQWATESIDLSVLGNPDNLAIAFVNKSGYGNFLYIDNINLSNACNISATLVQEEITCPGDCNGSANVTVNGAVGSITYEWSNGIAGPNDNVASNLCPGNYSVTVSDINSCSQELTFVIGDLDPLTISPTVTPVTGPTNNDAVIDAVITGGTMDYSVTWPGSSLPDVLPATNVAPGTYNLFVTDENDCTELIQITVDPYDCSTLTMDPIETDILCNGTNNGSIELNVSGGVMPYIYNWNSSAASGPHPMELEAGFYFVTVEDQAGCPLVQTFEISEPSAINISVITTDETSFGANDGTATPIVFGAVPNYTYNWGPLGNEKDQTNMPPGTYNLIVTDANLCSNLVVVVINPFDCGTVEAEIVVNNEESCAGENDGDAEVINEIGQAPFTYNWSVPGANEEVHTQLPSGIVTVTVTDNTGCFTTLTTSIEPGTELSLSLNIDNEIDCFGNSSGALSATIIGADPANVTYIWNNGTTAATNTNLVAGYYCLTITDFNGCEVAAEHTFTNPDPIVATIDVEPTFCVDSNDGFGMVNASGGTGELFYLWEDASTLSSNNNLTAGPHSVTITDLNDCQIVETFIVPSADPITVNMVVTNESSAGQNDGSISINPTGGAGTLSWVWDPPAGMASNLTNLAPGSYSVTISDALGCEVTETGAVVEGSIDCNTLNGNMSTVDVSCFGVSDGSATVEVQGGLEPYIYNWSVVGSGPIVESLASGFIQVTITDANMCETIVFNEVGSPTQIILSETIVNESTLGANDGSISLVASGGEGPYSFDWGVPIGMMNPITNLAPGIYQVTCTDISGCSVIETYTVSSGMIDCSNFTVNATGQDVVCFGDNNGWASATASGGSGIVTYTWSDGTDGTLLENLPPGVVSLTAVDGNGCIASASVTISEPPVLQISGQVVHESLPGANDGAITLMNSGGVGTPIVDWGPPFNNANPITSLSPGMYSVTVSDLNNCSETATFIVLPGNLDCSDFEAQLVTTDVDCAGEETGTATIIPSGGTMPYSANWANGGFTLGIINLPAGPISGTVMDANGCTLTVNGAITESAPIEITFNVSNESFPGAMDGSVQAMASGGQPFYTYDWGSFGTVDLINGLSAGIYEVTVQDILSCQQVESIVVSVDGVDCSTLSGTLSTVDPPCGSMSGGTATMNVTGGLTPYSYNWSEPGLGTNQSTVSISSGPISVTVLDANGCEISTGGNLNFITAITISSEMVIDASGSGMNDGSITVSASGGQGQLNYNWSNLQSGNSITNLTAGNYTVTITDALGNCQLIESFVVGEGVGCTLDLMSSTTPVTCNGAGDGTAMVTAQGGTGNYFYNWSISSSTNMITAGGGLYMVTVNDGNGCVGETAVTISEPNQLIAGIQNFPGSCGALGAASAQPTGGTPPYFYLWSTGATTQSINSLQNGTYGLTITDSQNCEAISSVDIVNNSSQFSVASEVQEISCPSGSDGAIFLNIVEGTPPYVVNWSTGSNDLVLNDLPAGSYIVQITDGVGCTFFKQFTLVSPGTIDISFDVELPSGGQNNGTIESMIIGGTPPFSYTWNGSPGSSILENVSSGSYICEITDANGCVYNKVINLWPTSTENLFGINEFTVYPNPTKDLVNIDLVRTDKEVLQLALYSMHGILVDQFDVNARNWKKTIAVDDYPAGVYFLYLNNGIEGIQKKLIIIK